MRVELTEAERAYCHDLAVRRNGCKADIPNHRVDQSQSDLEVHYLGVRGEFAVAKGCGVPLDTGIYLRGDGGVADFRISGRTVQVKTRKAAYSGTRDVFLFFNHRAIDARTQRCTCHGQAVRRSEALVADCALLVLAEKDEHVLHLLGYISREAFVAGCRRQDLSYGDRFLVTQRDLCPVEELIAPAPKPPVSTAVPMVGTCNIEDGLRAAALWMSITTDAKRMRARMTRELATIGRRGA